jgi:NTP pyrophosphatase (non-canonical NTP hydrolase)
MIDRIINLSKLRIKFLVGKKWVWYKWAETYFESVKQELQEAKEEYKDNNSVYLEDELWDVFWTYLCLLNSLESEWKITSIDKVFERCYEKFIERVWENGDNYWSEIWEEIKKRQKIRRKKEHEEKYQNNF